MKYWAVGASWDGNDDQTDRFLKNKEWFDGYADQGDLTYQKHLDNICIGDVLIMKANVLRKGSTRIKAIGIVKKKIKWYHFEVEWEDFRNKVNDFSNTNYAKTLEPLRNNDKAIMDFAKHFYNNLISMQNMEQIKTILQSKKQLILQGAPGTGKTYATAEIALRMIGKDIPSDRTELMKMYQEAVKEGQIAFTTFHQSMDYEEFMEGLKPIVEGEKLLYGVKNGIFKEICEKARFVNFTSFEEAYQKMLQEISSQDDEMLLLKTATGKEFGVKINTNQNLTLYTGNLEKSMGTLTQSNIILSFDDKVKFSGWESYFKSIGNYLKDKFNFDPNAKNEFKSYVLIIDEINRGNISKIFGELITLLEADKRIGETNEIEVNLPYSQTKFGVPSNVYIIGTMNTTDRSLGYIDYAVRRRFAFHTLKADKSIIKNETAKVLFETIEKLIKDNLNTIDFNIDDIMIGHSYFLCTSDEDLNLKLEYEIKPLLREYVKDGILNMSDDILNLINNLTI